MIWEGSHVCRRVSVYDDERCGRAATVGESQEFSLVNDLPKLEVFAIQFVRHYSIPIVNKR